MKKPFGEHRKIEDRIQVDSASEDILKLLPFYEKLRPNDISPIAHMTEYLTGLKLDVKLVGSADNGDLEYDDIDLGISGNIHSMYNAIEGILGFSDRFEKELGGYVFEVKNAKGVYDRDLGKLGLMFYTSPTSKPIKVGSGSGTGAPGKDDKMLGFRIAMTYKDTKIDLCFDLPKDSNSLVEKHTVELINIWNRERIFNQGQ